MFGFLDLSNNVLVKIAMIFFAIFLIINIVYLSIVSLINKDITVLNKHPILFTVETLLIGFGCGSIIFLIIYNRGHINNWNIIDYILLSLRLSIVSLLMQFSGVYTYMFS